MRKKPVNIIFFIILILIQLFLMINITHGAEKEILNEQFESVTALRNWNVNGAEVKIVAKKDGNGYCVKIHKESRNGFTYISKDFRNVKGNLRFEAQIQSQNIVRGDKNWDRGKFQAVVTVDGKDVSWPADDFHEDSGFIKRQFRIFDLTGQEKVTLRIGLQNARGTIWVYDIRGFLED